MNPCSIRLGVAMPLALLLAGCLGSAQPAPSDQDVARAVSHLVLAANTVHTSAGAAVPSLGVAGVKTLGCHPAPDYRGYLCETLIDTQSRTQGARQQQRLVRLVRNASGWQATMQ